MTRCALFVILLTLFSCFSSVAKEVYVCGMAQGFHPYQFSENGEPKGLDYQLFQKMAAKMNVPVQIWLGDWDDVVAKLRFGQLDCAIGMEWNQTRDKYFDFTTPYYMRRSAIFVLKHDSKINDLHDLDKQLVVGDRHSYFERYLKEQQIEVRNKRTHSKEQSFMLLQQKQYKAMIAPLQVGYYLADKYHVELKVLSLSPAGTPVSMVVQKGNKALLYKMEKALQELIVENEISPIFQRQ
ncbi:transporter substrate-binding domain-containing protein [Motilimonas sp. 1_MG-2023]|uniref:transporter substrate-binding domain-containing protein n=1 Tax=Motilimonas TaxID=1914248 RepID=UPI0026E3572A|nr:transporter substrate-binding domain-containing protein [Motilimonas sp. 1_MG-2023]MDO6526694.1 transporter substrate-binding domain-containing protein [Motilimonas sp. 1_MG-2023]